MTYHLRVLTTVPKNMVAYWRLNESSGVTAHDSSPQMMHGTAQHVTWNQPGIGDGYTAAGFDGQSGLIDLFSASFQNAFDANEGTLMCWFRNTRTTGQGVLFRVGQFRAQWENGNLVLARIEGNHVQVIARPVPDTGWHALGLSWSVQTNTLVAYLDGHEFKKEQANVAATIQPVNEGEACLGAADTSGQTPWQGAIAHVALWNRALDRHAIIGLAHRSTGSERFAANIDALVADGSADDTQALNHIIANAEGRIIRLPPGIIRITRTIQLPEDTPLAFVGVPGQTCILCDIETDQSNAFVLGSTRGVSFYGITFNGSNKTLTAFIGGNCQDLTISHCEIKNFGQRAIRFNEKSERVRLTSNYVHHIGGGTDEVCTGFSASYLWNAIIEKNVFSHLFPRQGTENGGDWAIYSSGPSYNVVVHGNVITDQVHGGIKFAYAELPDTQENPPGMISITNNVIRGTTVNNIVVGNVQNVIIAGNTLQSSSSPNLLNISAGTQDFSVVGNMLLHQRPEDAESYPIIVGADCRTGMIADNTARRDPPGAGYAIYLHDGDNVVLEANELIGYEYGLRQTPQGVNTLRRIVFQNNLVRGPGNGKCISLAAAEAVDIVGNSAFEFTWLLDVNATTQLHVEGNRLRSQAAHWGKIRNSRQVYFGRNTAYTAVEVEAAQLDIMDSNVIEESNRLINP